jgi:hypothetical protein
MRAKQFLPAVAALLVLAPVAGAGGALPEPVRYGRDVLPILSAKCFACHGPDEEGRQADLRLDLEAEVKADRDAGRVIAPGNPDASELLIRVTSSDADVVMPPGDSHKPLTAEQVEILRRWIAEGAAWGRHWSFEPVVRPQVPPAAADRPPPASPIDGFVAARLAERSLAIREPAPPHTLARRLALDLIGLPPDPAAADAFAADPTPAAYEQLVDDLLARPQFGEHWARTWLDLARYADTKGYEKDLGRTMWPYRDWVVEALNADMPLDRFTEEQLAGDLLPESDPDTTRRRQIATAFHRNTMSNDEGGTDDEEFRVAAVKDRIDTTVQVWMGLTMGCAKCHTHKYDPISLHDYYAFYALFNQTEDADRGDDEPRLAIISPKERAERDRLKQEVDLAERELKAQPTPDTPEWKAAKKKAEAAKQARTRREQSLTLLPIMRELPAEKRRITRIHNRGNFLDQGDAVTPTVLAAFGPLPEGAPTDRLGVARWLVSPDNPLTPRVWANRVWARLFGTGIVETEEDFGALGSAPSHPELLDWLAVEYRDGGWSLKKLVKTIVMSDTYRQRSDVTPALAAADPRNLLLSRGGRYRLSAETVRDQAPAGDAAAAGGPVAEHLQHQDLGRCGRGRPLSPRALHLLEADHALPVVHDVRRGQRRDLPGAADPHQHAAAGARHAQRPGVSGGGGRPGRPDGHRRRRPPARRSRRARRPRPRARARAALAAGRGRPARAAHARLPPAVHSRSGRRRCAHRRFAGAGAGGRRAAGCGRADRGGERHPQPRRVPHATLIPCHSIPTTPGRTSAPAWNWPVPSRGGICSARAGSGSGRSRSGRSAPARAGGPVWRRPLPTRSPPGRR